jgi:hypothetical protein
MGSEQINFRPTEEDVALLKALREKLGIGNSQIIRQAIRCLRDKEGIILPRKK